MTVPNELGRGVTQGGSALDQAHRPDGAFLLGFQPGTTTPPSGWTLIVAAPSGNGQGDHCAFYKQASSEPSTYPWQGYVMSFDKNTVDLSTPIETTALGVADAAGPALLSLTASVADCIPFQLGAWWGLSGQRLTGVLGGSPTFDYSIVSSTISAGGNDTMTIASTGTRSYPSGTLPGSAFSWSPAWSSGNGTVMYSAFALRGTSYSAPRIAQLHVDIVWRKPANIRVAQLHTDVLWRYPNRQGGWIGRIVG